jgi:hypothetical protein
MRQIFRRKRENQPVVPETTSPSGVATVPIVPPPEVASPNEPTRPAPAVAIPPNELAVPLSQTTPPVPIRVAPRRKEKQGPLMNPVRPQGGLHGLVADTEMNTLETVDHQDLTGQVQIHGIVPLFNGNYSCVYKGTLKGGEVSVLRFTFLGETDTTAPWDRLLSSLFESLALMNLQDE